MDEVTIDLRTAIIPQGQQIWSVFPGSYRRFLPFFIEESCVFLDFPAINLTSAVLSKDKLLRQHIVMSQQWASYLRSHDKSPPSRDPMSFSLEDGESLNSAAGNVKTLFSRVKPRDLILVGRQSIYDPILIGEVQTPFNPDHLITIPKFEGEQTPYREVKWLPVKTERRFLPQKLSRLLSNRKAIIHIDKKEFGEDVYKYAYGDYVYGENSRYIFSGPKYRNVATQAVPGIDLITYFAAAYNAQEIGEIDRFAKLGIQEAISSYFEQDDLYSFELDFSSPGEYILHARKASLPLLVAALIAATAGDISYAQATEAHVFNSSSQKQPDDCPHVDVPEKYKAVMSAINVDRFNELCDLNKNAQDGVGLTVGVKVRAKKQ